MEPKTDHIWSVAEAKAHLSELIDRLDREGPQVISRRGREVAVVVATDEWHQKTTRRGSLAEFFASSPLAGSGLEIEHASLEIRDVALSGAELDDEQR